MIEIKGFSYRFQSGRSLDIPELSIGHPGVFLIAGDNGSGKTTLIRSILGIIKGYEGSIAIDGTPLEKMKRREIASVISYLPQTANMEVDIPVADFIRQGLYSAISEMDPGKASGGFDEVVGLLELAPYLDRRFNGLSGGEKQMVRIARSVVADCRYSFLDEPDSFLSRKNKKKLLGLIEGFSRRRSIVIVSHEDIPFTENCRVLIDME